jgi:predicted permease
LCTAIGNTSFLAFPLISALLGEPALSLAAVYDQFGSFLALSGVAPWIVVRASGGSAQSPLATVKRVLSFAPFVSLVVALLLPAALPGWLDHILLQLSRALVPVAMFAVGLRLRVTPPTERAAFAAGLLLKLVLFPALALGLCALAGASRPVRDVAVLEAAMPASVTAGALAMSAGLAPRLAAALVGWGLLLAQLTVPAWALLLR